MDHRLAASYDISLILALQNQRCKEAFSMLCYLFFILSLNFQRSLSALEEFSSPLPSHCNYTLPSDDQNLHIIVDFEIKFRFTGGSFIRKVILCATRKERHLVRRCMLAGGYE